jgi:hypothetical protein
LVLKEPLIIVGSVEREQTLWACHSESGMVVFVPPLRKIKFLGGMNEKENGVFGIVSFGLWVFLYP